MWKPTTAKDMKIKRFGVNSSTFASIEKEFDNWTKEHPNALMEDVKVLENSIVVFYRDLSIKEDAIDTGTNGDTATSG